MVGERHTRQGCARGQAHGTLDREDRDLGAPGPWSAEGVRSADLGVLRKTAPSTYTDALRTISSPGCWCGLPFGHGYPGSAEGAPHPAGHHAVEAAGEAEALRLRSAVSAAASEFAGRGMGVLVVLRRGRPWRAVPTDEVGPYEVRYRAAPALDPHDGGALTRALLAREERRVDDGVR